MDGQAPFGICPIGPSLLISVSEPTRIVSGQALIQAGFASEQIIALGPEPVFVKELIVVDGLTSHTQYMSPFVMQALDSIAGNVAPRLCPKIYVPRRPSVQRDFENELAIAEKLSKLGFVETEPLK